MTLSARGSFGGRPEVPLGLYSVLLGHVQHLTLAISLFFSAPSSMSLLIPMSWTGRHLGVSHSDTDVFQMLRVQWLVYAHQRVCAGWEIVFISKKPPAREVQMTSSEMCDRPSLPHTSRHLATSTSSVQLVERVASATSVFGA